MALPGPGVPLSVYMINGEFGRTQTSQLSFDEMFSGTYAQNGYYSSNTGPDALGPSWISRNSSVGRTIWTTYNGGSYISPYAQISQFYSYNDGANFHWSYNFDNQSSTGIDGITVTWTPGTLYSSGLGGNSSDTAGDVDTFDFELYDSIYLELTPGFPTYVDIRLYDTDTGTDIYNLMNEDPNNYRDPAVNLGTVYGFQRFSLDLVFHD
jgi:hypothetical protein